MHLAPAASSPRRTPGRFAALAVLSALALGIACYSDPIVQTLKIGTICKDSTECGSQPWFTCLLTGYPGGYCTKACMNDQDCPPEAICAFTGGTGQCKIKCLQQSDCPRPSYTCKPKDIVNTDTFASHAYCDSMVNGGGSDAGVPGPDLAMPMKDGGSPHD